MEYVDVVRSIFGAEPCTRDTFAFSALGDRLAVTERNQFPILTTDGDFARFSRVVPAALHRF